MRRLAALALLALCALPVRAAEIGGPNAFAFVALGDMPYTVPQDYPRFEALIGRINALKPAFSVHVGDIKSGSSPCTDAMFAKVRQEFDLFEGPLVYAIGDNEWTDCHRERAGRFDPLERLAKVRAMFFNQGPRSLGQKPLPLERQSEIMPQMAANDGALFVENARWTHNQVMFVALHVPGSNNNFEPRNLATASEYFARNSANIAWLDAAFAKAKADGAKALVIALQADLWDTRQTLPELPAASGFIDTIKAVERGAKAFDKPVLLINGDAHFFTVTPFYDTRFKPVPKVTRLQVMGEKEIGAVRVIVDPDNAEAPFAFQPFDGPSVP